MAITKRLSCRSGACLVALSLLLAAGRAHADEPETSDAADAKSPERAAAQDAHRHALDLFDHGQYAEALAEFKRAYSLAPTFRILYNIGLSQAALGDALAAVDAYSRYLQEGADHVPAQRHQQVQSEIARLSKKLGWLQLEVAEPASEITVDGDMLGRGPLSRQMRLNVGRHTVSVRSADGTLKTQSLTLVTGEEQRLRFTGEAATPAQTTAPAPAEPAKAIEEPRQPAKPAESRQAPWVAWGVTGALGVSTVITGILALSARSDERSAQARQGVTHDELSEARSKTRSFALASDILLAGTVVTAGVSIYLTLRPSSSQEPATALMLGPGSVSLRRTF